MGDDWKQLLTLFIGGSGVVGFLGIWVKSRYARFDKRDDLYDAFTQRMEESNKRLSLELQECRDSCLACKEEHLAAESALTDANGRIDKQSRKISEMQQQILEIEKAEGYAADNGQRIQQLEARIAEMGKNSD